MKVRVAESDEELLACFPVLEQLRPHLHRDEFLTRVRRQAGQGYRVAFLEVDGEPRSVAGFRVMEKLWTGRVLHVDDLVTDDAARSRGFGAQLLDWLKERARAEGCERLQLNSGVQRADAHRFYEREGLRHVARHYDWATEPS